MSDMAIDYIGVAGQSWVSMASSRQYNSRPCPTLGAENYFRFGFPIVMEFSQMLHCSTAAVAVQCCIWLRFRTIGKATSAAITSLPGPFIKVVAVYRETSLYVVVSELCHNWRSNAPLMASNSVVKSACREEARCTVLRPVVFLVRDPCPIAALD